MPINLLMRKVGRTLLPARKDDDLAFEKLIQGRIYKINIHLPRSKKQHGRFFAAIEEAFMHWPATHEFQPENAEHLRAWLLCSAGHVEPVFDVSLTDDLSSAISMVVATVERRRAEKKFVFPRYRMERGQAVAVRLYVAATVNHKEVDQPTFAPVAQSVFEIIENIIGVPIEAMFAAREARLADAKTETDIDMETAA